MVVPPELQSKHSMSDISYEEGDSCSISLAASGFGRVNQAPAMRCRNRASGPPGVPDRADDYSMRSNLVTSTNQAVSKDGMFWHLTWTEAGGPVHWGLDIAICAV